MEKRKDYCHTQKRFLLECRELQTHNHTASPKLLERLMYNRLYQYLTENNLLSCRQFGFRKGKSTQDALLNFLTKTSFLTKIYDNIESGNVPVGTFDLSRAFDCLSHSLLCRKLESIGVKGNALAWFESYLKERPNRFVLRRGNNSTEIVTDQFSINVGVPQGSILGPLLFLIYIKSCGHFLACC